MCAEADVDKHVQTYKDINQLVKYLEEQAEQQGTSVNDGTSAMKALTITNDTPTTPSVSSAPASGISWTMDKGTGKTSVTIPNNAPPQHISALSTIVGLVEKQLSDEEKKPTWGILPNALLEFEHITEDDGFPFCEDASKKVLKDHGKF